jgi:ubiquinone/menaquinone biosynthesis C-methylase UbiE
MAFQPKQITQYQAEHLAELQGDVSETAIKYSLSLISPFVDDDRIHDNAAGSGAVTATIFEQLQPGTSIHIDATDVNEQFVRGCKTLAESKNWPVDTAVMSAQELTYPDNSFTYSFTSFAFHCLDDHDTAAK